MAASPRLRQVRAPPAGRRRLGRRYGPRPADRARRSSLRLPQGHLPGDRAGHDTSPARRPLPWFEQHRRAEPSGALGRIADPLDLGVRQPQRTPRLALDDPPAHSRTQVQSQIAARAASDQLRPPLQQLRVKCARPHLVAGVKFQVYYPSRSCPHCVHSGAHTSDDPGRPHDPSQDAVNAGRGLPKDSPARCASSPARSSGLPWLSAVAIDIAPGTDHYPYRASSPSTR